MALAAAEPMPRLGSSNDHSFSREAEVRESWCNCFVRGVMPELGERGEWGLHVTDGTDGLLRLIIMLNSEGDASIR